MSTKLSKQPISERQELADQRRVAVFMFIATHPNPRDPDHCFTESISYIANCIRGGNRDNVKYALESLIASGDIIVVEKERRHDPQGKLLPNRLGTVPIRTFWLREWIRGGSRGQKPALESTNRALTTPSTASGTQATCALGEPSSESPRVKPVSLQEKTAIQGAPVPTAAALGSTHKNSIQYAESPYSLSVGQLSTASSTRWSALGSTNKRLDAPVQRALGTLRDRLDATRRRMTSYHESAIPSDLKNEAQRLEIEIAELEGCDERT